ncbi:MAG: hypothetical protein IPM56_17970 [Ignavibacteriales bacterium]|nr:MAG: hypothetical protein IPM56_17970 [Ignavibacteriales bacterium]
MKTLLLILLSIITLNAQSFKVEKVSGTVKKLPAGEEKWIEVSSGETINSTSMLMTEKNSSVRISNSNSFFMLKESSAVLVSDIKKMTTEELLLALAMEDMLNAPRKKEKSKSHDTAVYGTNENGKKNNTLENHDYGIKRLNGAKQLSENGFNESAVIAAKETYRKYPSVKEITSYRIFFADILFNKGLNEEAYGEYVSISKLTLSEKEKADVEKKIELLEKKIVTN